MRPVSVIAIAAPYACIAALVVGVADASAVRIWAGDPGWIKGLALGGLLASLGLAAMMHRGEACANAAVMLQIRRLAEDMRRMAHQEWPSSPPAQTDGDVLSHMARSLAVFRADSEEVELRGIELEEIHSRFEAALNNMMHGLLMIDADLRVVLCNHRMHALFNLDPDIVRPGATMDQVVAHSIARGNHPGQTKEKVAAELRALCADCAPTSFQQTLPDGRLLSVNWVPMPDGGWVCTYEDITTRTAAIARATHLARHDPTTGLPNRAALVEALQAQWPQRRNGNINLLCLEVQRFSAISDACGHRSGDVLLRSVAERLSGTLRTGDLIAHLGGARFAILQAGTVASDAGTALATRIRDIMLGPMPLGGQVVATAVYIGMASSSLVRGASPDAGAETLLRNATLALHRAIQKDDSDIQIYADDMDRIAQARHALETDLRAAVTGAQFELHYQPLVSVSQQRVTGFEALLRWRHPSAGMIAPAIFIPLAEELGLIRAIGTWVLYTACAEATSWPDNVRVAVNLSPLQFAAGHGPSLHAVVADALASSGLPGGRLELEITESVRLQDDAATLGTLHKLRGLGARISLDDFGTGYSSLSYLRCFPFDKLKIDQSFVRSLPALESAAIVRAVAALGSSLGIATVAEGVETAEQLRALIAEDCDEMQGYLFSPPRPAADVASLLQAVLPRIAA